MANSARQVARGTLWSSAATYGGKALVLVSTIILARLLDEATFGIVAIALLVIAFLEVLQDLGIGSAVIYEHDEDAAHTGFWLGMGIGIVLFGLTWIAAPLVVDFFNEPQALMVLRVLGLSFPLFALRNIHDAILRRRMEFDRRFWPEIAQTLGKGGLSIGLALAGTGVWSLVWGQLGGAALGVIGYWIVTPWRPRWLVERVRVNPLLRYGTSIVIVNALAVALAQVDYVLVGRYLGKDLLGVYTVAFRIPDLLLMQFCVSIAQVIFPMFSRMRDDPNALSKGFLTTTRYVALVTVPLGLGMALVSRPFVLALFSERWSEAIPVMPAIALYALLLSLSFNAGDVYKAQGRAGVLSWLSLARLVILVPALWWAATVARSIEAVAWTHVAVAALGSALNLVVAARLLNTPLRELFVAFRPALVAGGVMTGCVYAALLVLEHAAPWLQLPALISVGVISYAGTLWLVERPVVLQARTAFGRG